jgi:transposase InsO family protein
LRRELLNDHEPFDTLLAAQAAIDTWITEYNCDRPHQSLDDDYPATRFAPGQQVRDQTEQLLPLRIPAILEPAPAPDDPSAAHATEHAPEPATY